MSETKKRELAVLFVLTALLTIFFLYGTWKDDKRSEIAAQVKKYRLAHIGAKLDQLNIKAKAVSVYDAREREELYDRNATVPLPLASLTKIMTVLVALNIYGEDGEITISPAAINLEGNYGLLSGEKWKVGDLARFTLVSSANDGAYALAEGHLKEFLNKMNEKARAIDLKSALFLDPTGLDIGNEAGVSVQAGSYASARDVNTLALFALRDYPDIFSSTALPEITVKSLSGFTHTVKNTDPNTERIPNLLFSKTGTTDMAGGNLSVIFKNAAGHEIAITVLGSTHEGRFTDVEKIVDTIYDMN